MNTKSYFLSKDLNSSGKKTNSEFLPENNHFQSNRTYRCKDAVTLLLEQKCFVAVTPQNVLDLLIFFYHFKIIQCISSFTSRADQYLSRRVSFKRVLQNIHKTKSAECMKQRKIPSY